MNSDNDKTTMPDTQDTSSESQSGTADVPEKSLKEEKARVAFDAGSKPPNDVVEATPAPEQQHLNWTVNTNSLIDRDVDEFNEMMLRRVTRDAGLWAFGVVAVEVWIHSENANHLYMPKGGYWRDPVFEECEALSRLEDTSRSDYVPPDEVGPMVGLPGVLWTEVSSVSSMMRPTVIRNRSRRTQGIARSSKFSASNVFKSTKFWKTDSDKSMGENKDDLENNMKGLRKLNTNVNQSVVSNSGTSNVNKSNKHQSTISTMIRRGRRSILGSGTGSGTSRNDKNEPNEMRSFNIAWRSVPALAMDPDQPPNERLWLLADAGFGLAAGVRFDIRGYRGLVIYLARASVNTERLQSSMNERYMRNAAYLIAAESALSRSRKASIEARAEERRALKERITKKLYLLALAHRKGTPLEDVKESKPESSTTALKIPEKMKPATVEAKSRFRVWLKKAKGLNVNPPPRMPPVQIAWTFTGVFITEAVLLNLYFYLMRVSGGTLGIPTGILSAVSVMHFGLTAAPATQPRNFIYGQFIGCLVPIIFLYIFGKPGPEGILSQWLQGALATGFTGAIQVALGVTHPPAAASALIFTLNDLRWGSMGVMLLYSAISVLISLVINNMSTARQYPVYWALGTKEVSQFFQSCCGPPKEKAKLED